jgi:hypothetical protein
LEGDFFQERRSQIERTLAPGIIAEPLLSAIQADERSTASSLHRVIVELNTLFPGGLLQARNLVAGWVLSPQEGVQLARRALESALSGSYIFADLTAAQIRALVTRDGQNARGLQERFPIPGRGATSTHRELRAILRIWDSPAIGPLITGQDHKKSHFL